MNATPQARHTAAPLTGPANGAVGKGGTVSFFLSFPEKLVSKRNR